MVNFKKLFSALTCVVCSFVLLAQNQYRLEFLPDKVLVRASFTSCSPVFRMFVAGSSTHVDGQESFISKFVVHQNDQILPLEKIQRGKWMVPGLDTTKTYALQISYEVALNFDEAEWGSGVEEMAFQTDEGWVFTMRSLFYWPEDKYDIYEPIDLIFDLSPGESLYSPWNLGAPDQKRVTVPNFYEFLFNTFMIGKYDLTTLRAGNLLFYVTHMDGLDRYTDSFNDVIKTSASFYQQLIGAKSGEFLIIYSKADRNDGGAFENSFSQTIYGKINGYSKPVWAGLTAHELSHLWNGRDIVYAGSNEEWIIEGFADYLSALALIKQKQITPDQFMNKLENSIRKYLLGKYITSADQTIVSAGQAKNRHRLLIYGGGALIAWWLDETLTRSGKGGIGKLMRALHSRRQDGDESITTDEIVELCASWLTVEELAELQRMLYSREFVPFERLAERCGFQLDVFGYEDVTLNVAENTKSRSLLFGF